MHVDFDATFYVQNRSKLAQQLPGFLLVIPAHSRLQYSADMAYPFRQDSNFWYLSGIDEPDCVLLINTTSGESTLLLPKQNKYQKVWDGAFDFSGITGQSGITAFGSVSSLKMRLLQAKKHGLQIGYAKPLPVRLEPYGFYTNPSRLRIAAVVESVVRRPKDIRPLLARMRQVKQQCEIDFIQKAIDITGETLKEVKQQIHEFSTEKDVERALSAGFYTRGADGHAYEPIVASGPNAAIIHYQKNNQLLQKNKLLLLDVGAMYGGYAADISRTWAVGEPTSRQKELTDLVAEIQQKAYSYLKPGVLLKDYQKELEKFALSKQKKHGVDVERYPHGFSHFLGLDVHDAGDYDLPLQPGVVLTVEPGVYLASEGIGIRIEDNVVITDTGCKILSVQIPQTL